MGVGRTLEKYVFSGKVTEVMGMALSRNCWMINTQNSTCLFKYIVMNQLTCFLLKGLCPFHLYLLDCSLD